MGLRKPKKAEEIKLPDLSNAASAAHILSGFQALDGDGEVLTGSIPSQAAQTITPGTSDQTISAGKYLSGDITVKGDSMLKSANILAGRNIFGVQGSAITGYTGVNNATFSNCGESYIVPQLYLQGLTLDGDTITVTTKAWSKTAGMQVAGPTIKITLT